MNDFFYEPDVKVLMLKGEKGDKGEKGNTIVGIEKTSTSGLVDTYTISFNDGTTSTFNVTNGEKGDKGEKGDTGAQGIQGEKGEKGDTGTGVPVGGKAGQYLKKKTDADYDFEWSNIASCPFPVGFGGFFQTDPNSIYSGTKWEQKKDVFILAAGTAYPAGSTGGEATHHLTVDEMPNHTHHIRISANDSSGGIDIGSGAAITRWAVINKGYRDSVIANDAGGSQPHNNMPPYFAMPFWIRTA